MWKGRLVPCAATAEEHKPLSLEPQGQVFRAVLSPEALSKGRSYLFQSPAASLQSLPPSACGPVPPVFFPFSQRHLSLDGGPTWGDLGRAHLKVLSWITPAEIIFCISCGMWICVLEATTQPSVTAVLCTHHSPAHACEPEAGAHISHP